MIARRIVLGIVVGLLAAAVAVAVTQPRLATRVTGLEVSIQQKIGVELAVAGVYLEESGIPMPVPSEVGIGYLGQRMTVNPLALGTTWFGLTLLIVLGSTNLFAASRRFGPALVDGRLGKALHLTPSGVARAQRWFQRWGPLAIGLSRYVPGLRWGMAVACGTLGVRYRTFWWSTAISASVWAAALLTLGVTVGDGIARLIAEHAWMGLLLPLPAVAVVTAGLVRLVIVKGRATSSPSVSASV
ncbi:MAG: DedA family protein [Chloroflexi bacterium]|nr:MAG: DedA family protein [Chloroflexota bacterium]